MAALQGVCVWRSLFLLCMPMLNAWDYLTCQRTQKMRSLVVASETGRKLCSAFSNMPTIIATSLRWNVSHTTTQQSQLTASFLLSKRQSSERHALVWRLFWHPYSIWLVKAWLYEVIVAMKATCNSCCYYAAKANHICRAYGWLERKISLTSSLLMPLSEAKQFSVIVDGTQDASRKEQLSLCLRYGNAGYVPSEDFIGLYEPPDNTGATIAQCIEDALLRLNLPLSMLRVQTYDGASNMSGQCKCQFI